jgi:hypothetical protein
VSTAPSGIVAPRIAGRETAIVHAESCVDATGATMRATLKSDAVAPCLLSPKESAAAQPGR